jgi:hypothetical protein
MAALEAKKKMVFQVMQIKEKQLLTSPFFAIAHKIYNNPAGGRGDIYYERALHDIGKVFLSRNAAIIYTNSFSSFKHKKILWEKVLH